MDPIQVLNSLRKRKPSKRVRRERSKQNVDAFIRRQTTTTSKTKPAEAVDHGRILKNGSIAKPNDKNAVALRAADKLISDKCKKLHKDILEMIDAQKEHRKPKIKRNQNLSYFDFEDDEF